MPRTALDVARKVTTATVGERPTSSGARAHDAKDLRIAGLVPLSTVDWPGRLTATLFCQGCPWRCTYCHNEAILNPAVPGEVPWQQVVDLLARRSGLLDGVVFSGGEATMQHALISAMRQVREMGFQVGLHTGGAFPQRIRQILNGGEGGVPLVDWVGFDVKATPDLYSATVGTDTGHSAPHESERGNHRAEATVSHPAPRTSPAWARARHSFLLLARAGVPMEVRTTVTPALAPHLPQLVEVLAGLWHEAAQSGDAWVGQAKLVPDKVPGAREHSVPMAARSATHRTMHRTMNRTIEQSAPRRIVFQQARAEGAPIAFAASLPKKHEWDAAFIDAVENARAAGARHAITVDSR